MTEVSDKRHRVFVYGTLRQGEPNHHLLESERCLGACVSPAAFSMLDLGPFPGVVKGGSTAIAGEVYKVDDGGLSHLDMLERYPALYTRERIHTHFGSAWIYLLREPRDHHRVVDGGDWCDYLQTCNLN